MNRILCLALAFPLVAAAQSAPRTLEQVDVVRPQAALLVDCDDPQWPTLREVAAYNGVSVFDLVPDVRHRIVIAGSRACRRGASQVRVVFEHPDREVAIVEPRDGR